MRNLRGISFLFAIFFLNYFILKSDMYLPNHFQIFYVFFFGIPSLFKIISLLFILGVVCQAVMKKKQTKQLGPVIAFNLYLLAEAFPFGVGSC
jgi:hypothetical protein